MHNEVLAEYRTRTGIADRTQPAPDLARHDGAIETPLWLYRDGEPREPLFVRRAGETWELLGARGPVGAITADPQRATESLAAIGRTGLYLAPRALTLTMFLRTFLADAFVHGIGGAIYEEAGDVLTRRWFGQAPQPFITASATLRLPLSTFATAGQDRTQGLWDLHHAWHNPQRYAEPARLNEPAARTLLERHESLLGAMARAPRLGRERADAFMALQDVKAELRRLLDQPQEAVARRMALLDRQIAHNQLATDREYFVGLMPAEKLQCLAGQATAWAQQAVCGGSDR
jgi:hypothetical protein